jgi:hypothetical protein
VATRVFISHLREHLINIGKTGNTNINRPGTHCYPNPVLPELSQTACNASLISQRAAP